MKKLFAFLLAAVMLASTLCVGTLALTIHADVMSDAPAADAPAFVLDTVSACAGDTVQVALRVVNNPGIVALRTCVTYDPAILTPTAMVEQDFAGATFGPLTANPLSIMWVDTIHPDVTDDGVVALLTFTVAADAPVGDSPLLVSFVDVEDIYNADFETVTFTTVHGGVSVVDYVPGDINGDTKVNVRDLGLLQQYLNGWDVVIGPAASDVTGDGKVNVRDLGLLQQYLNGWDVTLQHGNHTGTTTVTKATTTSLTTTTLKVVTDQAKILADIATLGKNECTPYIAQLTGKVQTLSPTVADEQNGSMTLTFRVGDQNIKCYQMKGLYAKDVAPGDTITVKGVIKNYWSETATKGTIEFYWHEASGTEVTLVKLVKAPKVDLSTQDKILAAAFALQPGDSLSEEVSLTGKVVNIEYPYDDMFQNITVNITVEDKTLKCYRMMGNGIDKIKEGDTITVKGYITNYSGTVQFSQGCEMTKRVAGTASGPETDQAKILADAFSLAPGAALTYQAALTGTITAITTEYSPSYNNITVIIAVGGKEIKCYRLKAVSGDGAKDLKVGDTITVTGLIKNYQHSSGDCEVEFDAGCTFVFA